VTSLNEAITSDDLDKIKEATQKLQESSMEIGKSMYSQTS
jgi:hypothetical protein